MLQSIISFRQNAKKSHSPSSPTPAPKPCITQATGAAKEKFTPLKWNPVTMSLPSKPWKAFITPARQKREAACQCIRGSLGWEVTWHLLRGLQLSSCHTGLPSLSSAASQLRSQEGKAILRHTASSLQFHANLWRQLFWSEAALVYTQLTEVLYSMVILKWNFSLQRDADVFWRATIENSSAPLPIHPLKHSESTWEANSNLLCKTLCYFSCTMAGTNSSPHKCFEYEYRIQLCVHNTCLMFLFSCVIFPELAKMFE